MTLTFMGIAGSMTSTIHVYKQIILLAFDLDTLV